MGLCLAPPKKVRANPANPANDQPLHLLASNSYDEPLNDMDLDPVFDNQYDQQYNNYEEPLTGDGGYNDQQFYDDQGYPLENYSHEDGWNDGSNISSQSSNNTHGSGGSNGRPLKKMRRKRPRPNPNGDFNGLLSPDDDYADEFGTLGLIDEPAPSAKMRRTGSNMKFKPKKGQVWLWTSKDVRHWIQHLGDAYREYAADFEDNAVDGQLLLRMDNNDYHELGVVSPLHVKKIQVELDRLVQGLNNRPKTPKSVIMAREELTDSSLGRRKKKKKKRPKKQALMAFPPQYAMYPGHSLQRMQMPQYDQSVTWIPSNRPRPMRMQMPMQMPMSMPMQRGMSPMPFQLCTSLPVYE